MSLPFTPYPRILKQHLPSHQGATVTILGKLVSLSLQPTLLTFQVHHQKNDYLEVTIDPGCPIKIQEFEGMKNMFVEVMGRVEGERVVMNSYCGFGGVFDLETYNDLVKVVNVNFKHLFEDEKEEE